MKDNVLKLLNDILFDDSEKCTKCDKCNECDECCCDEKLDLGKDEDYEKFNKYVDECKKICDNDNDSTNNLTRALFETLFGFDMKDILDDIKKAGDEVHKKAVEERKKEETKKVPELPSKNTPYDKQANLHKIVGEYVDTYIRPYGNMDKNVVDDVYAGLFEFACWVLNK